MALVDKKFLLTGVYDVKIDGNDVGLTADGIQVTYSQQFYEHVGDQCLDTVKLSIIKYGCKLAFGMKEVSLENLAIALNQKNAMVPSSGHETLTLGMNVDVIEHSLTFTSVAPEGSGKKRTFTFGRCVVDADVAFAMKKAEGTILPLSVRVLPDTDVDPEDCYGTIDDEVTP